MAKKAIILILASLILLFLSSSAFSQEPPLVLPKITIEAGEVDEPQELVLSLRILLLLTILSLAPAILIMVTSFTRIVVVLGFARNALGSPQIPPTAVLVGLSLFLTFFIMAPTFGEIQENALSPYLAGNITQEEALDRGVDSLRNFMFRQTQEKDLALLVSFTDLPRPKTRSDIPTHVLIPAFILSELRAAFTLGFLIYIPFLVIDMVVASILMSMGMMMLPPVMISLPFKLLLFVLVDGWDLVARGLTLSFR
ncbi:MAG TPA: flagellar type III secretion system pore protein FliP [Candidatus Atribacteria bacterium]|nr:flagellar type III secretion system pore protein FliP [Candidatus Atribacteria bacterium]HPT62806.1 flagellar type III secretion system pore protein FliP [Candidatus Atribacteria bacterium]HQE24405.1 flagellar type III secretion system pore protein FliP [Candidatus Atribacteria bacterium]